MRPYWKGYLKLALVSCPIALHAACSSAERIAFRQINKATGAAKLSSRPTNYTLDFRLYGSPTLVFGDEIKQRRPHRGD